MAMTNAQGLLDAVARGFHLALSSRLDQIPACYQPTVDTDAFMNCITFKNEEGEVIHPSAWSMPPSEKEKRAAQGKLWKKMRLHRGGAIPHVVLGNSYQPFKKYMESIGEAEEDVDDVQRVRGRIRCKLSLHFFFFAFCFYF